MDHPEPRPTALIGPIARLEREFLQRYRGTFLLGLLGLVAQSLLLLPIPILQGQVLDRLVPLLGAGPTDEAERRAVLAAIALPLGIMLVFQLARALVAWWVSASMGRVSQEVVVDLRSALHRKLLRLPMAYFDANQTGRIMARVTSDVGSILSFVNSGLLQLVNDMLLALGIAVVLVWLEWRLALVALVVVPLYAVNHQLFARRLRKLSLAIRAQVSALYALLSERVSAVRIVRSFAQEQAELARLDQRIDAHRDLSWQNTRAGAALSAIATLISGLGTVAVIALGTRLVGWGALSVGELLAFYSLVGQLYGPIVRLSQFQATAQATCVSVERLFEVLDEPEPVAEKPGARPLEHCRGALALADVSFRYHPEGPLVLEGIDLVIGPGMTLGVVGPSGAGKSTLLALMPRLYDVTSGTVRLDGHDVRDLRLGGVRRAVGLVSQQALLFEGTIRSNLTYACPDADDERLWSVLEIADLAATVRAFPRGLDAPVGERGLTLSGGQRQRLALARALVAGPAVLLLDDCTSALDADTEARIQEALDIHLAGTTRVIVSHKAASVRRADWIIVIERGRITEQGTHEALLAAGGHYADSYEAQTEVLGV